MRCLCTQPCAEELTQLFCSIFSLTGAGSSQCAAYHDLLYYILSMTWLKQLGPYLILVRSHACAVGSVWGQQTARHQQRPHAEAQGVNGADQLVGSCDILKSTLQRAGALWSADPSHIDENEQQVCYSKRAAAYSAAALCDKAAGYSSSSMSSHGVWHKREHTPSVTARRQVLKHQHPVHTDRGGMSCCAPGICPAPVVPQDLVPGRP